MSPEKIPTRIRLALAQKVVVYVIIGDSPRFSIGCAGPTGNQNRKTVVCL